MVTATEKKKIGMILLLIFIPAIINYLFGFCSNIFEWYRSDWYVPSKINILYCITDAITLIGYLYAALNKKIFNNIAGYVSAWLFSALLILFTINTLGVTLNENFNLFSFLGSYANLTTRIVYLTLLVVFLFSLKTWLPIKIIGVATQIIELIISLLIIAVNKAWMAHDSGDYNYETIDRINSQIEVTK